MKVFKGFAVNRPTILDVAPFAVYRGATIVTIETRSGANLMWRAVMTREEAVAFHKQLGEALTNKVDTRIAQLQMEAQAHGEAFAQIGGENFTVRTAIQPGFAYWVGGQRVGANLFRIELEKAMGAYVADDAPIDENRLDVAWAEPAGKRALAREICASMEDRAMASRREERGPLVVEYLFKWYHYELVDGKRVDLAQCEFIDRLEATL